MAFKSDPSRDVFIEYENGYKLHLQYGTFDFSNGIVEEGYRYIWEYPDGKFQSSGQTRIPSNVDAIILMVKAIVSGLVKSFGGLLR